MANKKSYVSPELELFNVKAEERIAAAGCSLQPANWGPTGCGEDWHMSEWWNLDPSTATSF